MYYYLLPQCNGKIKTTLGIIVFTVLSGLSAYSQTSQEQISTLLTERENLIAQSENTLTVDQQLFNLGYRPKAQVTIVNTSFSFPLFLPVAAAKQAVMQDRLRSVYPFLVGLQLNEQTQTITALVNEAPTAEMIAEIISHFGFNGYENN